MASSIITSSPHHTSIYALLKLMILMLCSALSLVLLVGAADEDPLQDFCVADLGSDIPINGYICKPADTVTVSDFTSKALRSSAPFNAALGSAVNLVTVNVFPGVNTLGLSIARLDFQPNGLNTPHVHPRASEAIYLAEGTLVVAFLSAAPNYTLFQTTLQPGDLFVFPRGLVHYQMNPDHEKPARAIAALGSQNPGREDVAAVMFGSKPQIPDEVLEKAFGVDKATVKALRKGVAPTVG